jgi:hypothetical protein
MFPIKQVTLTWLVMLVTAVANAAVRETQITPLFGAYAGHVISTLSLCAIIIIITFCYIRFFCVSCSRASLIQTGVYWAVLTIIFEFIFGCFIGGLSWSALLADYNILCGRIWVLVPLTEILAPVLCYAVVHDSRTCG